MNQRSPLKGIRSDSELVEAALAELFNTAPFGANSFLSNESDSSIENGELVSASDRVVGVRDNQGIFDELDNALNAIRDEFARDHNKGSLQDLQRPELISVIKAVQKSIKVGYVGLRMLVNRLMPALAELRQALNDRGEEVLRLMAATELAIQLIERLKNLF